MKTCIRSLLLISLIVALSFSAYGGVFETASTRWILHPVVASPIVSYVTDPDTFDSLDGDYCISMVVVLDNIFTSTQTLFERKFGTTVEIGLYIDTSQDIVVTHTAESDTFTAASTVLKTGVPFEISVCYASGDGDLTANFNGTHQKLAAAMTTAPDTSNGETTETLTIGAFNGKLLWLAWSSTVWDPEASRVPLNLNTGAGIPNLVSLWMPNRDKAPTMLRDIIGSYTVPIANNTWEAQE